MLSRRLHKFLKVVERRTIHRLHIAGNNVHSNLSFNRINVTRNLYISSRLMIVPTLRGEEQNTIKQNKIITRSLHSKTYDDKTEDQMSENNLAYALLKKSDRNLKTLAIPLNPTKSLSVDEIERILCEDWTKFSAKEALETFKQLSYSAKLKSEHLSEEKHSQILNAFGAKVSELTDEELCLVFGCLSLWHIIMKTKFLAYTHFWSQLDNECCRRLPLWDQDKALLMCDYWYSIKLAKKASYTFTVLRKLGRNPKKLDPTNFLHYMFVINTCRKPPISIYELEFYLGHIIDQYNANELGIFAMAFFKCQTPIRDQNILTTIQRKVIENIDDVEDFCISAVMKISRYSTGLRDLDVFEDLLAKLEPRVPKLTIPCLTNILHAAAGVQAHKPKLMKAIIRKFEGNISEARIKDLERLSWVLGIFDYDTDAPIYHKIIESFRDPKREMELALYPKSIPTTLSHFSFANIFPIDLINKSFAPDFLFRVYENNAFKIGWDFFSLENNMKIDFPEYDGPFLKPTVLKFLSKKFLMRKISQVSSKNNADKFVMEVTHMCKSAVKIDTPIVIDQVLPHYVKPDIILCFDDANNPVDPQPILSKTEEGYIKYVPDEAKHLKWFALILATQNQIIKAEDRYVGPLNCKVRQLKKIGYTPIVINIHEWRTLPTLEFKLQYLKRKLHPEMNRKVSATAN